MSCEFVTQLSKLRKLSAESVENTKKFDPFKEYLHVERQVLLLSLKMGPKVLRWFSKRPNLGMNLRWCDNGLCSKCRTVFAWENV